MTIVIGNSTFETTSAVLGWNFVRICCICGITAIKASAVSTHLKEIYHPACRIATAMEIGHSRNPGVGTVKEEGGTEKKT